MVGQVFLLLVGLVGLGLLVFGGFVLVRFPDRYGGRIAFLGAELSSPGAGLIVLGLGAVLLVWATVNLSGPQLAGQSNPVAGATLTPTSGASAQTAATAPLTSTSVPTVVVAAVPATCTPTPVTGEFALKDQPGESYHELGVIYPGEEATVDHWSYATDTLTGGGDPWLFVEVTRPRDGRKGWMFSRESNGARPNCSFDLSTPSKFPFPSAP